MLCEDVTFSCPRVQWVGGAATADAIEMNPISIQCEDGATVKACLPMLAVSCCPPYQRALEAVDGNDSSGIVVEADSESVATVLDFVHYGIVPLGMSKQVLNAFTTLGVSLVDKPFDKIPVRRVLVSKDGLVSPMPVKIEEEEEGDFDELDIVVTTQDLPKDDEDAIVQSGEDGDDAVPMKVEVDEEEMAMDKDEDYDPKQNSENKRPKRIRKPRAPRADGLQKKKSNCLYCDATFISITEARAHMMKEHQTEHLTCTVCHKVFGSRRDRNNHEKTRHQSWCCEVCGMVLSKELSLKEHVLRQHTPEEKWPFKCEECPKKFVSSVKLKEHIKMHENKQSYVCHLCGERFNTSTRLCVHRNAIHEGKYKFWRKGKSGTTTTTESSHGTSGERKKRRLKVDMSGLTEIAPTKISCNICGRIFTGMNARHRGRNHILSKHTPESELPHQCNVCQKGFARRETLQYHLASHENMREHACSYCDARFNYAGNRNAHEREVHLGIKKGSVAKTKTTIKKKRGVAETAEERNERWKKEYKKQAVEEEPAETEQQSENSTYYLTVQEGQVLY